MNAKVFHLMSRVHETRFLVHPESCQCGPNESVCNSKQKWNHDKCPCNCKKFDGWVSCKNDFMWSPSTCGFECNKACKINEYLGNKNC